MMFLYLVLTLAGLSSQQSHVPENTFETCSLKLDRGDACCPKPNNTIRFYFDAALEQCFTYLYEGCGGGRNTFYTEHECQTTCIPADKQTCGGNVEPTGACHDLDPSCPNGSSCQRGGLGVGLCCDVANEEEWQKETHPTCQTGDVLKRNVWYGTEIWIGKSCSHRFCPYGYECIQGKRVAHCCGPIPNFKEKLYSEEDNSINGEYPSDSVEGSTNTVDSQSVNPLTPRDRGVKEQTHTGTGDGYRRR